MANQITGSPYVIDTAATIWDGPSKNIQLVQWIDVAADIADDDDLVITINNQIITGKIQLTANEIGNLAVWTFGPFDYGIGANQFGVTTIDAGALLVVIK